jgi:hypothetical protein
MTMSGTPAPDAEDRFLSELAKHAHALLVEEGHELMFEDRIEDAAQRSGAPDHVAVHVVRTLEDQGLIWRDGRTWKVLPLAVVYEKQFDRDGFRRRNVLRRSVLRGAAQAFERNDPWLQYSESAESSPPAAGPFINVPYAEAAWAVRLLEFDGYVELSESLGRHFRIRITPAGYSLVRNESELTATLPVTASEDEEAHAAVAPDALQKVIRSCEEMLDSRGWIAAREELSRGDSQYKDGHWVDAVREYYAALESGLKHRMDEAAVDYGDGDSLKALARVAAGADLIPTNYQAAFGFLDSIRSPRSHGRGSKPAEIPIGPAEALLAGNQVRTAPVLGPPPA